MNKEQRKAQQFQQKQLKREYKLYVGEMKATNDTQGIIEGYLNAIGNIDYGRDRTLPGAFKRTLNNAFERKKADGDDYLWPYLWNHDYDLIPPGGIFDASEDKKGLYIKSQLNLDYQLARDMYSSFKARTLKKQSMGYICHQSEYVKAEVDGVMTTVRDLIEVEVLEGSGVVFPMNDLADVTGVKRHTSGLYVPKYWPGYSNAKGAASGKTTWPLAPRSTKWDSGQATKDIESWADGDWSKVAECFFWIAENPPTKLADCKLPFVAKVGGEMQAVPQGIISGAGTIQGAMGGVDIPDGDIKAVKAKIKSYYTKMDMTPPWETSDDGKRSGRMPQTKDFLAVHQAGMAADCLEDWGDLLNEATTTMFQIFSMSDTPKSDMQDFLEQFAKTVMDEWEPKAEESALGQYLNDQGYCSDSSNNTYVPYSLRTGDSGYMSRRNTGSHKSGASFSQANTDAIHGHVAALHDMADAQAKSMHDAADGLLDALSGLGAPTDPSYRQQGTTADDEKAFRRFLAQTRRKSGAEFSEDNLKMLGAHVGGLHDVADTLHQMAEDLAENTGATTYVDPDGNADNAKESDKDKAASHANARRKTQHSPNSTAESQDDLDGLLSGLKSLKIAKH